MKIVIASNNKHKMREFAEIFPGHQVMGPDDFSLSFEYEETGSSFFSNAQGKADVMYRRLEQKGIDMSGIAVMSDDSGLVIPALGGEPGVYSARYGSEGSETQLTDEDRNLLVLDRMSGLLDRKAYYVCCMVLISGEDRFACVQETWHGTIAEGISSGRNGFGYDPLFFLPEYGCTVAEIPRETKASISHRAKASHAIARFLG